MTASPTDVFRIIDAAANRTREGLRVIEDYVRFGADDGHLSHLLKRHRHELAEILGVLPASSLLASRDTINDVGTTISTSSEYARTSSMDVVCAAFKRVQEALRTLEEYTKVIEPGLSPRLEQLRYRLYTTEKAVLRTEASQGRLGQQGVYLLVTAAECRNGLEATVKEALEAGVGIIQSREKSLSDRDWLQRARDLRNWTSQYDALLIVNDRPDLAVLAEADGVHVGQDELSVRDCRRIVGPDRLVGVSTHSLEQAQQAVLDGADYLGVGPTFPSATKSFEQFPGLEFVQAVAANISLPWFAIGGIDVSNVHEVVRAGATRVAVSSVICRSPSPGQQVRTLLAAVAEPKTT